MLSLVHWTSPLFLLSSPCPLWPWTDFLAVWTMGVVFGLFSPILLFQAAAEIYSLPVLRYFFKKIILEGEEKNWEQESWNSSSRLLAVISPSLFCENSWYTFNSQERGNLDCFVKHRDRDTIQDVVRSEESHKNKIFHMSSVWSAVSFLKLSVHLDKHSDLWQGWWFLRSFSSFKAHSLDIW